MSKKEQFFQRVEDMDIRTLRQAQSVLADELGLTKSTVANYYSKWKAMKGTAVKRPRRPKDASYDA